MEAKIDEHSRWIKETDPDKLKDLFEKMLIQAGFGILNFSEHYFSPQGYTGLWLISESHFAVHTFPEESTTYIQLSSCNSEMFVDFIQLLDRYQKDEA